MLPFKQAKLLPREERIEYARYLINQEYIEMGIVDPLRRSMNREYLKFRQFILPKLPRQSEDPRLHMVQEIHGTPISLHSKMFRILCYDPSNLDALYSIPDIDLLSPVLFESLIDAINEEVDRAWKN